MSLIAGMMKNMQATGTDLMRGGNTPLFKTVKYR